MRQRCIALVGLLCVALAKSAGAQEPAKVDSLVMERTLCFGSCPAYRLRVARDGSVSFHSRNPGDSTKATDRKSPNTFAQLVTAAIDADFYGLPRRIQDDRELCAVVFTDHPSVTIRLFASTQTTVNYYEGCYVRSKDSASARIFGYAAVHPRLEKLRALASAIDSTLESSRWVRPAGLR